MADAVGVPTVVVGRVCDDLTALGVLSRVQDLAGREHRWSLSDAAGVLIRAAGLQSVEATS
jgi:hypothetical protein